MLNTHAISAIFLLIPDRERHKTSSTHRARSGGDEYALLGAIAQLGERVNGIHEVVGSIPSGSTIFICPQPPANPSTYGTKTRPAKIAGATHSAATLIGMP